MTTRTPRPSRASGDDSSLVTRSERKQRTRGALLDAALKLISEGRSFTSLGLREITREAGVVPTSFYRHFRDMEELGLALVEEGGLTLRRLLREARKRGRPDVDMVRRSVEVYKQYVEDNRLHFFFIAGERHGGSPLIRRAVRNEATHFINEMAEDIRQLNIAPQLSFQSLQMICNLIVSSMLSAATDILDLPPNQPQAHKEMLETYVQQMRLIFLGTLQWKEKPGR
ncbi:MAG TPA: HTH-type transcriptional repressor FabR [Solimonas sp.]|nr:HTH-type transcriptional repressor FabR [Solimonas sp.]